MVLFHGHVNRSHATAFFGPSDHHVDTANVAPSNHLDAIQWRINDNLQKQKDIRVRTMASVHKAMKAKAYAAEAQEAAYHAQSQVVQNEYLKNKMKWQFLGAQEDPTDSLMPFTPKGVRHVKETVAEQMKAHEPQAPLYAEPYVVTVPNIYQFSQF
eukprot:GEMP01064913.1.p1 GENE.GEMP01064913.1~~GEMP01064913.1.p1  ORF type:complete len:156 (+),score=34.88 GEMP01064913.1:88-555(+)